MTASPDALALSAWIAAVARELGLGDVVNAPDLVDIVLDLTSDVAHGVSRPGAPVTAFLIGVAAGRAADPDAAARDHAETISRLARRWDGSPQGGSS